jgi:membrane protein DedA with SNARE-associated domain
VRFTVMTAVGSGLWNAVLMGAGYALGANWDQVSRGVTGTSKL